jgi:hypothetical protein
MMTDGDKAVDEETATKARERVKALMESRPRPEDAQAKVMGVLNEAQKKALQGAMTRLREDGAKKGKAPEAGAPGKPAKELSDEEILNDPRLPERMKEKLKGMSAEERAEALKRLRDRLSNADGPGKRGAGGGGEEKKAPSSKDVKVPAQPK